MILRLRGTVPHRDGLLRLPGAHGHRLPAQDLPIPAPDLHPEDLLLRDGAVIGIYAYDCPISEKQILRVEVRSGDWKILRWQAVTVGTWQAEETVTVWDGAAEP